MIQRLIIISLLIFSVSSFGLENTNVREYVDNVIEQTKEILDNEILADNIKINKLTYIARKNFDVEWMANRTLGRYKKKLSKEQLDLYNNLYGEYILNNYSGLVKNYKGEEIKVVKIKPFDIQTQEYIVVTNIIKQNGSSPIRVDYLIRNKASANLEDNWNIMDIITEGISMINTQQSEFSSIISNSGFDELISILQKKTNSNNDSNKIKL